MKKLVVACDGSGEYKTIASALKAAASQEATIIYIKNGIYNEKLVVTRPNLTLIGEDRYNTIIRYGDGARMPDETGEPMGTFKTATVQVTPEAVGFNAYNLTFENNAGLGSVAGQAVALYLDCDKAIIKDCRFLSRQDTLLTAPMYADIEADPHILNRQFFKDCYVEGDVDFIFGGAVAYFDSCTIYALKRPKVIPCYLTAACTSGELRYGYVFDRCKLTGSAEEGTVYLGRPWREHANTVFINCTMDKCMNKQGFAKWNDTDRHLTANYAQYGSSGEGYDEAAVAEWSKVLTPQEAEEYTMDKVFGDWVPDVKDYKELI